MASTASTRVRVEKQGDFENLNTWGSRANTVFDRFDEARGGTATVAVAADVVLSAQNFIADEARMAWIKFTGAGGFTVTAPAVSYWYIIWNSCSADITLKPSGGTGSIIRAGKRAIWFTDGSVGYTVDPTLDEIKAPAANVPMAGFKFTGHGSPTASADVATKGYVDGFAFNAALPGGTAAGQVAIYNGSVPVWGAVDLANANARTGILPVPNGGTGLATLTTGSVLVGNGAGNTTLVAPGTAGRVLTSNGAGVAPSFQVPTVPGMVTVGTLLTPTGVATLDITLSGSYSEYFLAIWEMLPQTDNVQFWLRSSTNAGSTFDAGASDYEWVASSRFVGASPADGTSSGSAQIPISGNQYNVGNASNENGVYGGISIYRPTAAKYCTFALKTTFAEASAGTLTDVDLTGRRRAAADVDTIRLLFSSGNIASGFAQLYARPTA